MLNRRFLLLAAMAATSCHRDSAPLASHEAAPANSVQSAPSKAQPAASAAIHVPASEPCTEPNATSLALWGILAERMDAAGNDCNQIAEDLDRFLDEHGVILRTTLDEVFARNCELSEQEDALLDDLVYRGINRPNLACQYHQRYYQAGFRLVSMLERDDAE